MQLFSHKGSSTQKLKREITDLILLLSLANVGTSCFRSVFIILCLTIKSFFYLYLLLKIKSVYELSSRLPSYTGFCSMRRLGVLLLPSNIKLAGTHPYVWVERATVRIKCLAQEHNTNPDHSLTKPNTILNVFKYYFEKLFLKYS